MTNDQIIEMAKQAYLWERINTCGDLDSLISFARLIEQQTREECAAAALNAPIKTARQDQREACAAAIREGKCAAQSAGGK